MDKATSDLDVLDKANKVCEKDKDDYRVKTEKVVADLNINIKECSD